MIVFLCNCGGNGKDIILDSFLASTVQLPDRVIEVQNGQQSCVYLPSGYRLVYYYSPDQCYDCLLKHTYDLCKLFNCKEFNTVILFCPKGEEREGVLENAILMNYNFPIYFPFDNDWISTSSIPDFDRYHVFLMDPNNHPVFVGDPIRNGGLGKTFFEEVIPSLSSINNHTHE